MTAILIAAMGLIMGTISLFTSSVELLLVGIVWLIIAIIMFIWETRK